MLHPALIRYPRQVIPPSSEALVIIVRHVRQVLQVFITRALFVKKPGCPHKAGMTGRGLPQMLGPPRLGQFDLAVAFAGGSDFFLRKR